ncbi:DGQHR domain-containing protein [Nostoc edaphicum CCNP1411]|uniref:DGQHR domain-containing protein n=1 Tax=Nostoc edaphicum CCNP1411 TaxID=1472755 RepID=A0A7D7LDW1_9NOSO|nr:DGQHR domain-containing protein [Nostoc edaphicum]QMS91013.1 DGQHR domain-containing protein [Nostoc edaphicum CCNP1411]
MQEFSFPYIEVNQANRKLILTKFPAGLLTDISYASVRGQSDEEGAVQRLLNPRRITNIKNFTLEGGDYPGAIILNWISKDNQLQKINNTIVFKNMPKSAQLIDGQHRLAGIKAAIVERESISTLELPVAIYENLSTNECADIFLSINTEQKTVSRSLVFDLYGLASQPVVIDRAAERARDIAIFLNKTPESPFHEQIKFPGSPTRKGGIALSTVVTTIKPLVEEKGSFEHIGVFELEMQKQIILNFFIAIKQKYDQDWYVKTNAFNYAAGFAGAMEFLQLKILPYCNLKSSFKIDIIDSVININKSNLIHQDEVKGMGGKDAQKKIYQRLVDAFNPEDNTPRRLEI